MNKALVLIILFAISQMGCHKCIKCTETTPVGDNVIDWPETCGKKSEIEQYESKIKSGVNPGNTVTCTSR